MTTIRSVALLPTLTPLLTLRRDVWTYIRPFAFLPAFPILVPTTQFYDLSNITWEAFSPRLDTLLAEFFFPTARPDLSQNRPGPRAAFASCTPLHPPPTRFYSIQIREITAPYKAEDVSVQEYLILVLRRMRRSLIFLDKSLRAI